MVFRREYYTETFTLRIGDRKHCPYKDFAKAIQKDYVLMLWQYVYRHRNIDMIYGKETELLYDDYTVPRICVRFAYTYLKPVKNAGQHCLGALHLGLGDKNHAEERKEKILCDMQRILQNVCYAHGVWDSQDYTIGVKRPVHYHW